MRQFFIIIMILIFTCAADAQFKIDKSVIGSGGGKSIIAGYILMGTTGQVLTGKSASTLNQVSGGFWYTYTSVTGVNDEMLPQQFMLYQNYPNPFNPVTRIRYELPEQLPVTLKIYNALGELSAVIVNAVQNAGSYEVDWNASGYASGFYICRIEAGKYSSIKKLILIK